MNKKKDNTIIIVLLVVAVAAAAYFLLKGKSTSISIYEAENTTGKYNSPWTGLTEAIGSAFSSITDSVSNAVSRTQQYKLDRQQQSNNQLNYIRSTSGLFADGILFV